VSDIFKHTPWSVEQLVSGVETGSIRLPDIQRPFVWTNPKVRDLFDSMYRGYPVGELMFWENNDEEHSKAISETTTRDATFQVVDGQQRLTSMYAVLKGIRVWRDNYDRNLITLSFNPFSERFEVPTPFTRRSAEWLDDIRLIFEDPYEAKTSFIEAYAVSLGKDVPKETLKSIDASFTRLHDLRNYPFEVVQLNGDVQRETVADVFVRINSEGVSLQAADFILTWLSVFWESGRSEIEEFSKGSHFTPQGMSEIGDQKVTWTAQNPYFPVTPSQVVRLVVGMGLKRGKLQNAYDYLRGRNPKTREIVPDDRERALSEFKEGQKHVLNRINWDEFQKVLERAGLRSGSMISSQTGVLYTYVLWLIGRVEFKVPVDDLRELMARWIFMSQLTSRYTGSSETIIQEDITRLMSLENRTAADFVQTLNHQLEVSISNDWWSASLPDLFETSSVRSPSWLAYIASLNILDANVLLSNMKVNAWITPGARPVKGIEKHHLFPREYLKKHLKITNTRRINQVANLALVEWSDNINISDSSPGDYWPGQIRDKRMESQQVQQMQWHGLPTNWCNLSYDEFLVQRRTLMAQITHQGFLRLSDPSYVPQYSPVTVGLIDRDLLTWGELFEQGFVAVDCEMVSDPESEKVKATVDEDGSIRIAEVTFTSPEAAANSIGSDIPDAWEFWSLKHEGEFVTLSDFRDLCCSGSIRVSQSSIGEL